MMALEENFFVKSKTQSIKMQLIESFNTEEMIRKNIESTLSFMKKKVNDGKETIKRIKNPGMFKGEEVKNPREKSFLASEKLANTKKQGFSGPSVPEFPTKKRLKTKSK